MYNDVGNVFDKWFGKDAKWIDECEGSSAPPVTLSKVTLWPSNSYYSFWGGDPTGVNQPGCFKFGDFNEWAPYYAMLAFKGMKAMGVIDDSLSKRSASADKAQTVTHKGTFYQPDFNKDEPLKSGKECKKMRELRNKY